MALSGAVTGAQTGQNMTNASNPYGYSEEEAKWRLEQLQRQQAGLPTDPAWAAQQLDRQASGQATDAAIFNLYGRNQTQAETGAVGNGAGEAWRQFLGNDTQHPGWNKGEAGPPGSPDYVRYPEKYPNGWQMRDAWFAEGENWKMLDPRWRPVNMWYQKDDAKSIAYLQDLAAGRVPQDQVAWDWDPVKAKNQLIAWGKWPQPAAPAATQQTQAQQPAPPPDTKTTVPASLSDPAFQNASKIYAANQALGFNPPSSTGAQRGSDYFEDQAKEQQKKNSYAQTMEWYKRLRSGRSPW